jgi:hypothetical protein
MLMRVMPGMVLISLNSTAPVERSMKKSARASPRQPMSCQTCNATARMRFSVSLRWARAR